MPDEERNTAEMLLYGEISEYSWYGDEITPSVFNQELKDLGAVDEITVRINSGGGDVFAAVAIYTRLKEHKAKISVKIDGWCASAATIIAMAGDTIEISVGGVFMIHDPLAGLIGYYNTTDLENIVKELETIKQSIVNCYMTVTDKSEEEIKSLMTNEGEWFTGEEAVEAGFCTAVMFTDVDTEVENAEKVISSTAEYAAKEKDVVSTCKVTAVNEKGTHKYHCISQDGKGVYGWVNAESIKELSSKAHSDPASVSKGDIVTFTGGGVYKSSTAEYASVQKNVTSTCKVTAVNTKGTHPYHCISQEGKGVYGWVNAADVK